jgi:hypothetical protein
VSWPGNSKRIGGAVLLLALAVAILGPWAYNLDGVPPPEYCSAPNILLENGRCARLVPGFEILATFLLWLPAGFVWQMTHGQFALERSRELGFALLLLLIAVSFLLPFIAGLLHIWRGESRRLRIFFQGSLGLTVALSLLYVILNPAVRSGLYWGMWVYLAASVCALLIEGMAAQARRRGLG